MINAIFAVDEAGGLGFNNSLPWSHNPTDLAHFKGLTENHTVVMGRNTWDSLPESMRPLPNRHNIIVTSRPWDFATIPNVTTVHPHIIDDELQIEGMYDDVFLIGGKQLIMSNLHLIDKIHLTVIQGVHEADVVMDMDDVLKHFNLVQESTQHNNCIFKEYVHEAIS
jgi:dihydrofolate reductase